MNFDDKDLKDDQTFEMPKGESLGELDTGDADIDRSHDMLEDEQIDDADSMDTTYYAIMGVIVLVMCYILYSMYTALIPVEEQIITPITQQEPVAQVAPPSTPAIEMPVSAPTQRAPEPEKSTVTSQVVATDTSTDIALSNKLREQQQAIDAISDDTQFLEKSHTEMNQKIDKLSKQLEQVIDQLDNMMEEAKEKQVAQKRAAEAKKQQIEAKKQPPVTYNLRAIVEGRAWLESTSGVEATVSVGQSLKDYGTVLGIYVNQGLVTTSSGRVITFKESAQ